MIPLGRIDNEHMQDRKNGTKSQGIITLIEINTLFFGFPPTDYVDHFI